MKDTAGFLSDQEMEHTAAGISLFNNPFPFTEKPNGHLHP